jgi:hypothetical protein
MSVEAFPLHWPEGWKRTPPNQVGYSQFKTSMAVARDGLLYQIEMLGGKYVVLSTNVRLRQDGLPYANDREPEDAGVAVYFQYDGNPMCFACDQYYYVKENIQAIRKTIEAIRGISRWGASDMMERAFTGFTALPAPGQTTVRSWRDVLGLQDAVGLTIDEARLAYKRLCSERHPDKGGSQEAMSELNAAWAQAQEALK